MAETTENRIRAINIAREGLEVVENIRDSNWIKLSSDYRGCFDALDYDVSCIGASTGSVVGIKRITPGSYTVRRNSNGTWGLDLVATPENPTTNRPGYAAQFPVFMDQDGLITQTGSYTTTCSSKVKKECKTPFTRELIITRPTDYSAIQVESAVTWVETGRKDPLSIRIPYTLYNWKYEFYKN